MAGGIAFPILPTVGERVGLSLAFIGVILAANRAARIVANPLVGLITDRQGGRRTLLAGLVIQIAVMFLYWLGVKTSHAGALFLAGRILHGPGSSAVFVAGQALALHLAAPDARGQAGGIVRGAAAVGVPVGLVLGGVLADAWGEAATFELASVALVVATAIAFFAVPDARVEAKRPSLRETASALSDPRIAAIGGLSFAASFAGSGLVLTTTVLLVKARHLGLAGLPERASASLFMGWLVVAEAVTMPVFGRLGDRRAAHAWIATLGVALLVPSLLLVAHAHTPAAYAIGLGLLGAGVGALGPSVLALLGDLAPPHLRGVSVGALQVCSDVGGAAGPLVGTVFFATSTERPYEITAILVALFVPAALWLARTNRA